MLDELMLRKIDLAHRCYVVNFNGYMGQGIKRAVEYAKQYDKPLEYMYEVVESDGEPVLIPIRSTMFQVLRSTIQL
jgi:hypothetical protein